MASSVHFKFKSQKEPSRVTFDGTGISVFELKREIITQNRLGDGSEFELSIYNEDTNEEYDDDTAIIPRSTSVIARRFPAARPGKGGAARYMSGKMPVTSRNVQHDPEPSTRQDTSDSAVEISSIQSEDEKLKALFRLQETQWKEQQQDMTNMTPVVGRGRGKPVTVPDHPPPPGYLCYRCGEKGHWIQACPTNNDPRFDGRYRVKRSTGIPRSFQKQVEKPDSPALDGSDDNSKLTGVMVNADGDFVIAQPDKASWELYQEKATASKAAEAEAANAERNKQLQDRGLLCPLDKRMLLAPTKTPCCEKTYCSDCITNALIESDFVCPNCSAEGVLLDNLSVDEDAIKRLAEFESEKAQQAEGAEINAPEQVDSEQDSNKEQARQDSSASKKRPATENGSTQENDQLQAPAMKKQKSRESTGDTQSNAQQAGSQGITQNNIQNNNPQSNPQQNNVQQPAPMNPFPQMPPQPMMGGYGQMNPFAGQDMMAMSGYYNGGNNWSQTPSDPYMMAGVGGPFIGGPNPQMAQVRYGMPNAGMNFNNFNPQMMNQMNQMQQPFQQPYGMTPFSNQQRSHISEPLANEEDSPYFRQPVNPHRHHGRQKRTRPSDYREL
ncbi:Protein mpe1 [Microsporum canis]|uniref:MPE1 n=1 Tax=Arthroderma otae (strain ATCC MYA-4605 / CBS 113480) TaxID=554155 RepID=C5FFB5_ARTOC|nr:MPE1 [Microsporum canis CBS 113480]EEQ28499.1 MPE1 [Microsporum canis CBS 113480]